MDGFKSDYQQLFQLFQTRSIVPDAGDASTSNDPSIATSEIVRYDFNFEKFMQCFEQMNFTYIFCGRKTENEAREFTDNIYEYILDNLSMYLQIEIRIFSMYLLYALWSIQHKLFSFEVNIRVDHSIHRNIQNLVDNCLKQNQFDVIVIYRKLFLSGAFVYCQEVDPKGIYYRKYFKPKSDEAGNIQVKKLHLKLSTTNFDLGNWRRLLRDTQCCHFSLLLCLGLHQLHSKR